MKRFTVGVLALFIFVIMFSGLLAGIAFYQDYSTRKFVEGYYENLIQGDYEKAYTYLHPWSEDPQQPLGVSRESAETDFMRGISFLREQGYEITHIDKVDVFADGSRLGATVKLTVSVKGETFRVEERILFYSSRMVIVHSQDKFAPYRDGKMG